MRLRHRAIRAVGGPGVVLGRQREVLLSSQTNRMRVAPSLLPADTAALKARLAQITVAYEQLHGGTADEPIEEPVR